MYQTKGRKFQQLEIGLASPKEIKSWAERYLPTGEVVGEVTSWETVNYKTLKPEPNGLFMPEGLSATWLLMIDPKTNEPRPVYVEPQIIVSPFPLHNLK